MPGQCLAAEFRAESHFVLQIYSNNFIFNYFLFMYLPQTYGPYHKDNRKTQVHKNG